MNQISKAQKKIKKNKKQNQTCLGSWKELKRQCIFMYKHSDMRPNVLINLVVGLYYLSCSRLWIMGFNYVC